MNNANQSKNPKQKILFLCLKQENQKPKTKEIKPIQVNQDRLFQQSKVHVAQLHGLMTSRAQNSKQLQVGMRFVFQSGLILPQIPNTNCLVTTDCGYLLSSLRKHHT